MYYEQYKEAVQEFYEDSKSPLEGIGYIAEGEQIDYEGYEFLGRCCIFISIANIAIKNYAGIAVIQKELGEIFERNVSKSLDKNQKVNLKYFIMTI